MPCRGFLSGDRYTPVIETVAEPDSFPIRFRFEEVGLLVHQLLTLFPTLRLFILCDLSQGVASLSAARSASHIDKGSSDVFRESGNSSSFKGWHNFLCYSGLSLVTTRQYVVQYLSRYNAKAFTSANRR